MNGLKEAWGSKQNKVRAEAWRFFSEIVQIKSKQKDLKKAAGSLGDLIQKGIKDSDKDARKWATETLGHAAGLTGNRSLNKIVNDLEGNNKQAFKRLKKVMEPYKQDDEEEEKEAPKKDEKKKKVTELRGRSSETAKAHRG
eukprot:TRINITY_DN5819_c0_g1_i1.p1 TRINITY_DN5819_c0_g1~~TRINITY_DN5819_c0_g1_i1.p1  ORF type:complete len:141 (+),score=56.56 TRINITY_DN5819_c0_g1_i1:102-524(+)